MADGGQAIYHSDVVERAARILAKALGTGQAWFADIEHASSAQASGYEIDPSERLAIARRGRVVEQAARAGKARHVRRQHEWHRSTVVVAIPQHRPNYDALAALSFAKLEGPLEAILLLYATGDVRRYWPTVKRFGLASKPSGFSEEALTDAMQRILCGKAAIAQDVRAKEICIRAARYRQLTKEYEVMLREWLRTAARRFIAAQE
ncbi:hypothetical protein [Dyella sp. Tek66A03]|uniref:hypothetical protein n=1 Tax=Dyella sp. Tek66A03 TaxID=3458298 RepID=UPI00403E4E8F